MHNKVINVNETFNPFITSDTIFSWAFVPSVSLARVDLIFHITKQNQRISIMCRCRMHSVFFFSEPQKHTAFISSVEYTIWASTIYCHWPVFLIIEAINFHWNHSILSVCCLLVATRSISQCRHCIQLESIHQKKIYYLGFCGFVAFCT